MRHHMELMGARRSATVGVRVAGCSIAIGAFAAACSSGGGSSESVRLRSAERAVSSTTAVPSTTTSVGSTSSRAPAATTTTVAPTSTTQMAPRSQWSTSACDGDLGTYIGPGQTAQGSFKAGGSVITGGNLGLGASGPWGTTIGIYSGPNRSGALWEGHIIVNGYGAGQSFGGLRLNVTKGATYYFAATADSGSGPPGTFDGFSAYGCSAGALGARIDGLS